MFVASRLQQLHLNKNRWMLSFSSILNESGKSSSEALHYCKMMLKSFKNPSFRRCTKSSGVMPYHHVAIITASSGVMPDDAVDRRKLGFLKDFNIILQ